MFFLSKAGQVVVSILIYAVILTFNQIRFTCRDRFGIKNEKRFTVSRKR